MGKLIAFRATERESKNRTMQRELENLQKLHDTLALQAAITRERERELACRIRDGARIEPGRLRVTWRGREFKVV